MIEPNIYLEALTPEAKSSIEGQDKIEIENFPFRVGRESRNVFSRRGMIVREQRYKFSVPNNELYLLDDGDQLNISREHFQIERSEEGGFRIVDRGSYCGTYVNNSRIDTEDGNRDRPLVNGDVIVVGTSGSPYVFKFMF